MLHKALCSGGILPLVKLYTSQEVGHGLHRNPEGADEFVLFSELYAGHQELDPATAYMARDIPLLNEKVPMTYLSCFFIKRLSVRNLFSMPQWIGGIVRSTSR